MDSLVKEILYMLDIPTLLRIKEQCERYNTYAIDFKQVNSKYNIKTRAQQINELLEEVQFQLVLKGFQPKEPKNTNNAVNSESIVKSSMDTQPEKKSRKKEK